MTEKTEDKVETLPDLDDLLQCPVCYEIPSGQIFQCNEGHHVCGRCKMRLDVCPVCRAFFFGTRNYAMEELIANVRKLRAFKLGGKVTTGSPPEEVHPEVRESSSEENESANDNANEEDDASSRTSVRPPSSCRGLFRCLCCKNNPERLPLARLLNHLRYYHSPDLIEGRSEEGEYVQAWQFPTVPGRMVTAVRVHDMGIFFLVIEVTQDTVHAWLSMAASPWVAHEFSYSFTLSGNDREAIFCDCVWSVRSCEGSLKRRSRCLSVSGADARALLTASAMSGKLSVRRAPPEQQAHGTQPRAVLRVANRSNAPPDVPHDLEPFLQGLQNDVARLSRAFATLGREANALVRSEAEMRARLEATPPAARSDEEPAPPAAPAPHENGRADPDRQMSRNARRRMRQRLREAFRENQAAEPAPPPAPAPAAERTARLQAADVARQNRNVQDEPTHALGLSAVSRPRRANVPRANATPSQQAETVAARVAAVVSAVLPAPRATAAASAVLPPPPAAGSSEARPADGNTRNKKKRRQRR